MRIIAAVVVVLNLFYCSNLRGQHTLISSSACSYYGETLGEIRVSEKAAPDEASEIIHSIISVIGLQPRFEIRAASIANAAAVIHNNKRFVLYNPDFIAALNKKAGSKWASVSILAHEIGHHLNGHTLEEGGSRPDIELEADEFSGFVLNKLGATLLEAQIAMKIAADVKESHTHPARARRLLAIEKGWNNGQGLTDKPANAEIKKPADVKSEEKSISILADKYIAKDVFFATDPEGRYYVTIRNNLVKVEGDQLYIIGRLAESNKKNFPAMLHDKHYNYLYITNSGKIVNEAGKTVGRIQNH